MKRSEAILKLVRKVVCPHTMISQEYSSLYLEKAERLLDYIEEELDMIPSHKWEDENSL